MVYPPEVKLQQKKKKSKRKASFGCVSSICFNTNKNSIKISVTVINLPVAVCNGWYVTVYHHSQLQSAVRRDLIGQGRKVTNSSTTAIK